MGTVDVGVGHDDDLVVAQLFGVQRLAVFFCSKAYSEGGKNVANFFVLKDAVLHGLFHVEDLTSKRKNGLEAAVTALLGRTPCGVSFDEEDLALRGIRLRTVGQLTGQRMRTKYRLALHHFARLAGGDARFGREHHLGHDDARFVGMLLEVVREHFTHNAVYRTRYLAVAQLRLRLAFKLGLHHFDADYGSQAFAEVVTGNLNLFLREDSGLVGVLLQRTRECATEAGEVRTALVGVDVVDVGMNILGVGRVVGHRNLNRNALNFALHVHGLGNELFAVLVDELREFLESALAVELLGAERTVVLNVALVG